MPEPANPIAASIDLPQEPMSGDELREIRLKFSAHVGRHLSQTVFGEFVNRKQNSISEWENEDRPIPIEVANLLRLTLRQMQNGSK